MQCRRNAIWPFVCLAAVSTAARAGDRVDLSSGWPADWKRVGPEEQIAIGSLATASILLRLFLKAPEQPRWDSPIRFDDGARNALRASSESARSLAGDFSNAAYALGAFPLVVDAGLVTWLGKGKADGHGPARADRSRADHHHHPPDDGAAEGGSGARVPSCENAPRIPTPTRIVPVRPIRETPPSSAAMRRWRSPGRRRSACSTHGCRCTGAPIPSFVRRRWASPRGPACSGSWPIGIG